VNPFLFKIILASLFTLLLNKGFSQAKEDTLNEKQKVIIEMLNGDEYIGQILKKDPLTIVLRMVNGEIKLIASKVRTIKVYDYDGKFDFAHPLSNKYFFGSSAIPLENGEGNYQNILATTNSVNYGITKNISISGGFEAISTIIGEPTWFLSSKAGFKVAKNIHFGGGLIVGSLLSDPITTLGYGVFTFGGTETNLSVGWCYGSFSGEILDSPGYLISGTIRASDRTAFVTENYVIQNGTWNTDYFGIHGIRGILKKSTLDFGAMVISDLGISILPIPYVSYVRTF
jgi:hypothetical protein